MLLEADGSDPGAPKKKAPVLSCFLEDKDGDLISESQKKDLFAMVASYWQYLLGKNRAPKNFRRITLEIKLQWRALMESQFECLRFCDGHWKSDQIWINYYPNWRKTALHKLREEKEQESGDVVIDVDEEEEEEEEEEDVDDDDDDDDDVNRGAEGARKSKKNKKGPSGGGETGLSKRPRRDEPRTTSAPSRPRPTMATTTHTRVHKFLLFIMCVTNDI